MNVNVRPESWTDVLRPVVIYNSGGIGDQLVALPALRALVEMFPGRVTVVCVRGAGALLLSRLSLLSIIEVDTFNTFHGGFGGIGMNPLRTTGQKTDALPRQLVNDDSDVEWKSWKPWTFDSSKLSKVIGYCDLLIGLTPWHSPAIDKLSELLAPRISIGFSPSLQYCLTADFSMHIADIFFEVPRSFDVSLQIDSYVAQPIVQNEYKLRAARLRAQLPGRCKILIGHAESKPEKNWDAERFSWVLDQFLEKHTDCFCLVVGSAPTAIRVCRNTARLVDSYPLDLSTTMAFLEMADLFIGVDSCMLHAADLCRIPGVGLFGPTSHATYGFRFSKHIHCGGVGTMNSITATSVLSALEEMAKSEGL